MNRWQSSQKFIGIFLAIAGLLGLLASYELGVESLEVAKNPEYNPSCNISPILSCSKVMASEYSEVFGIPNPYLGMMGFSALLVIAFLSIIGVKLPKRVWAIIQLFAIGGFIFVLWLFSASLTVIGSICPWCSLLWLSTVAIFWAVTVHVASIGVFDRWKLGRVVGEFIVKYTGPILIVTYLFFIVCIYLRFSDYWLSLLQ